MSFPFMTIARPRRGVGRLAGPRRQRAFSLIEMLMTIGLISIVMAISAPSLVTMIRNARLSGASEELLTSLLLARAEAIKRNTLVVVCNSADPNASSPTCKDSSPDWKTGWLIFVDKDGSGAFNTGDTLLRVGGGIKGLSSLTPNPTDLVSLSFRGLTLGAGSDRKFTFCVAGASQRIITVDKTGRAYRSLGSICT